MDTEYESLMQNETWKLVPRPENTKVLSNRWVFKIKRKHDGSIDKYKARLVVRGHEQKYGIDYKEVFAPVARYETVRTILAASVEKKMYVHQLDVISAYVQGDLKETVYMEQPEAFATGDKNEVCLLQKPLYGLKQSGRAWYEKLNNCLSNINLRKSNIDPCVFVNSDSIKLVIIVTYVDDLLIVSNDLNELNSIKNTLKQKFNMKDLGPASSILGINIIRNGDTGNIQLNQKKYILELLDKFGMKNCQHISTPMEPGIKLQKPTILPEEKREQMKHIPYRELVGGLIYLANATRPDISFAVSTLSRFCSNPTMIHWKCAKRVLRYLKGTMDYSLQYKTTREELKAYVDSDWAGDINDRKSCSGNVVILAGSPISWKAKKQQTVALSTMEAEYMALTEVSKEVIYLKRLFEYVRLNSLSENPCKIFCDSQSAIHLCKDSVYHNRSKHIDIRYHFCREAYENGEITLEYVSTGNMLADMLTKPLCKNKHVKCVKLLGLSPYLDNTIPGENED